MNNPESHDPQNRTASDLQMKLAPDIRAVNRLSGAVSRLVEEIRHQDFSRLEEAIEAFVRIKRGTSGFPVVRPADCRSITAALSSYLEVHRKRFVLNDPFFSKRFIDLLDRFSSSDIRAYPNEVAQLQLLRMEALILSGRHEEALELSGPLAERPYLVEGDVSSLSKLFEMDTLARLSCGQRAEVEAVALGRLLLLVRLQPKTAYRSFARFSSMLAIGPVAEIQYSPLEIVPRLTAKMRLYLSLRKGRSLTKTLRPVSWAASMLSSIALRLMSKRQMKLVLQVQGGDAIQLRRRQTAKRSFKLGRLLTWPGRDTKLRGDILVTRAMGGLGDIMMMTPGLKALAAKQRKPVYFATKRQFFPLLENNPDVRLLDVDAVIDMTRFRRWVNLSFCPAGRYESRHVPKVKKGRVELFARAMGVRKKELNRYGWKPRYELSAQQERLRAELRQEFGSDGLPIIGVQPYSRDTYKNCAGLFEAISQLADQARVVIFHSEPVNVRFHANIIQFNGRTLNDTLAAVAACDYFVGVDTAFFHVAAAFEIPSLGIFGPTDGQMFSMHHPCSRLIAMTERFPCAPCWRNEDIPCFITKGQISVCLSSISSDVITEAVTTLMRDYPQHRPALISNNSHETA